MGLAMLLYAITGITVLTIVNAEFSTEACHDSGKHLSCDAGKVLSIDDVLCLPYNYTCPEKVKIMSLCNGYRSCASIGLRQQLWPYCKSQPGRKMEIKYSCVKGRLQLPCRTNICSNESLGLQCKQGDVIHILKVMCSHGETDCRWNIYHILYSMCEGKRICLSAGLRLLGLQSTCNNEFTPTANVIVDYICIQSSITDDTCTGNLQALSSRFGVISSPDFPNNPQGNPNSCNWVIYLGKDRAIDLTIHLAFSRELTKQCTPEFLQVSYTDCNTMTEKTEIFCQPSEVNNKRESCGNIYIRSYSYPSGEDRGNRFLLSYQVNSFHSAKKAYVPYIRPCASDFNQFNVTSSVPYFSASDRDYQATIADNDKYEGNITGRFSSYDPDRHILIFKVVVINFFLFVIAFCLVVALIFVCYRYKRLSKHGNYNLTTQSDSDSGCPNTSNTPMQTFSENTAEQREATIFPNHSKRGNSIYDSLQSEDLYAKVDDMYHERDKRKSGTSSFRPAQSKNPYASYDSLDFDLPPSGHVMKNPVSEITMHEVEDPPLQPPSVLLQNPPESSNIPHYVINNDEYAIVQKPRRRSQNLQDIIAHDSKQMPRHSIELSVRHEQRPSSGHSSFSSDVGFLPHHNCMLSGASCNVPPFPNPPRQNGKINF